MAIRDESERSMSLLCLADHSADTAGVSGRAHALPFNYRACDQRRQRHNEVKRVDWHGVLRSTAHCPAAAAAAAAAATAAQAAAATAPTATFADWNINAATAGAPLSWSECRTDCHLSQVAVNREAVSDGKTVERSLRMRVVIVSSGVSDVEQ